jgi:hypothetical protein
VRGANPFHYGGGCIFLDWASLWGTPLLMKSVLPRDTELETIGRRYCSGRNFMSRTVVSIASIDSLAHRCIEAMIV